MQIQITETMPTRPCEFCLALQGDSVFADFNLDESNRIYLVRISFDGHGCCYPSWEGQPLKIEVGASQKLLKAMNENNVATDEVAQILSSYFTHCGKAIWTDALHAHKLI